MAQASSFKSSIHYQVCNSTTDNDISRLSSTKPLSQGYLSTTNDDLREITISSPTNQNSLLPSPSSNHLTTSSTHFIPLISSDSHKTSLTESKIIKIPIQPSSSSSKEQPLGSSLLSLHSLTKQSNSPSQQQQSRHLSTTSLARGQILPLNTRQSGSKQSILNTIATKITAVRKSSTTALPGVPSHSSNDNTNLVSNYQGDYIRQSRQLRKARRQDIKARFEKFDFNASTNRRLTSSRRFTFIFDPSGRLTYWWTSIISLAFLYNFWIIIFRFSFHELTHENLLIWFICDYTCDFLYLMDIMFNFRTAYLEEGVLQTDPIKLRHYYMNTTRFYIDCLCLMPLDFLYLSIGFKSIVRLFRLVKIYRFWTFLDRTERHTNYPNLFRTIVMIHYLLAIFHWNACVIYILHTRSELGLTKRFAFTSHDSSANYFQALYWSISALTLTQNHETKPASKEDYMFLSIELIFALLLFATIMGHVASIVSNLSNARKDFQAKLDAVKTYMSLRRVPNNLEDRVIRWFDYLWMSHKSVDDNQVLSLLPYKLRAEIAIHVHLDTLKRVEIFQNTEAGFLNELVLRLKPVLFSPGDYICRKGEVGREMYIVNRGKLHVMADNNKTVLATLKAGSYFGEISILNMGSGNRRTASVRSVGYSDLFCLSKEDLWEVLKEYPAVRVKLEAIAVKRLEKHKKPLIQQVNLKRSKSAPGLIEASCRLPFLALIQRKSSGIRSLSPVKEINTHTVLPVTLPSNSPSDEQEQLQPFSFSLYSLLAAAPLATSISVTSSLNSTHQPTINHSVSWSPAADTTNVDKTYVGRTISMINNGTRNSHHSIISNEIEQLEKRLVELEKEDLTSNATFRQEYMEIKDRLKNLDEKQFNGGR